VVLLKVGESASARECFVVVNINNQNYYMMNRWERSERVMPFSRERDADYPKFTYIYYIEQGILFSVGGGAFTSLACQNWLVFLWNL
jgi:hypothetical protein